MDENGKLKVNYKLSLLWAAIAVVLAIVAMLTGGDFSETAKDAYTSGSFIGEDVAKVIQWPVCASVVFGLCGTVEDVVKVISAFKNK